MEVLNLKSPCFPKCSSKEEFTYSMAYENSSLWTCMHFTKFFFATLNHFTVGPWCCARDAARAYSKGSIFSENCMNFFKSPNLKENIPNHYPELEIWISCLLLIVIWNISFGDLEIWKTHRFFWKKAIFSERASFAQKKCKTKLLIGFQ